ncbi:nickel-binding protein [Sandaracinus amylolyticus]|uniref:nickel-binding protein n=1 Tax=Sandaracinus amylolyticus TaxID=927083 RepID=UPI001F1A7451|nr:nickel-binding protein [Sandaracinus amylolyticus]UJR83910.1 Hypothetical protein I5071_59810 [Sandaracinus amylolyticus]
MATIIVEHHFSARPPADEFEQLSRAIDAELAARGGRFERSYLSEDGTRMICELTAKDAESVRDAFRAAKAAFDTAWVAQREEAQSASAPAKSEPLHA